MAPTQAAIGYGSTFAVENDDIAGQYDTLAEIYDITPPSQDTDQIDATHSQSPNRFREFIQGLINPGEASFSMNFVPGSAADVRIQELRDGVTRSCRITFPNGVTWTFDASLSKYEPKAPTADKMTATVTFKVSGSIVNAALAAPVNSVLPAISGTLQVGETLTAWPGVWSGAPSFAYQWKLDGANIAGATASTYVPVAGDATHKLSVAVTGTNTAGNATAASALTDAIAA